MDSKSKRPLLRGYRLGRGFWGLNLWLNRERNPVFSVVKTPKNIALQVGRWNHIWGPL